MLPDSYSRKFRLYYNAMIPLVAATSRVVVTASKFSKRVLVEHRIANATRIRVIPNGHEHVFEWRPEHATFAPDALRGRPFFVLVGSHAEHKNLAVVGGVASRIRGRGAEIVVAGGGGSEFARHNLPGAEHFHFLGVITDDDLAWLCRCLVGQELFGVAVRERPEKTAFKGLGAQWAR